MSALAPCPACQMGQHENHVAHWMTAPPGVLGGAHCGCPGDCKAPDLPMFPPKSAEHGVEMAEKDALARVAILAKRYEAEGAEITSRTGYFSWHNVAAKDIRRALGPRVNSQPYCDDCPDHEGCSTGYPCGLVKRITPPASTRGAES